MASSVVRSAWRLSGFCASAFLTAFIIFFMIRILLACFSSSWLRLCFVLGRYHGFLFSFPSPGCCFCSRFLEYNFFPFEERGGGRESLGVLWSPDGPGSRSTSPLPLPWSLSSTDWNDVFNVNSSSASKPRTSVLEDTTEALPVFSLWSTNSDSHGPAFEGLFMWISTSGAPLLSPLSSFLSTWSHFPIFSTLLAEQITELQLPMIKQIFSQRRKFSMLSWLWRKHY